MGGADCDGADVRAAAGAPPPSDAGPRRAGRVRPGQPGHPALRTVRLPARGAARRGGVLRAACRAVGPAGVRRTLRAVQLPVCAVHPGRRAAAVRRGRRGLGAHRRRGVGARAAGLRARAARRGGAATARGRGGTCAGGRTAAAGPRAARQRHRRGDRHDPLLRRRAGPAGSGRGAGARRAAGRRASRNPGDERAAPDARAAAHPRRRGRHRGGLPARARRPGRARRAGPQRWARRRPRRRRAGTAAGPQHRPGRLPRRPGGADQRHQARRTRRSRRGDPDLALDGPGARRPEHRRRSDRRHGPVVGIRVARPDRAGPPGGWIADRRTRRRRLAGARRAPDRRAAPGRLGGPPSPPNEIEASSP